jgi:beta-barrel assembly-enhancing protease
VADFFYNLGKSLGTSFRKGKWMVESTTGNEADAIRAEHAVGRDLAQALLRQTPADPDPDVIGFLEGIGARLADRVRNKLRKFSFRAVLAPERNAFALPGGFVFVTRPLLELCGWDVDEVAFVLAHEMGHVLHGDAMERIRNGWLLGAAGRVLPFRGLGGTWLFQAATQLVHTAYSRDQELAADTLGVQLAHSGAFDPHGGRRLLCRLQAHALPGSPLDAYFATHPSFPERLANVNRYLDGLATTA